MANAKDVFGEHGGATLAALDRLRERDAHDGNDRIAEAMRELVQLRDALIACSRAGEDCGEELDRANGMISALFGVEFPVSGVQWRRVCEARDALREMLAVSAGNA